MIPVRLNRKIEDFLLNRGLVLHPVRQLIRNQIYLSVLGTVIVLFSFSSPVFMGFFIGAVVGTLNFYVIAKLIQELVHVKKGATVPLLFQFLCQTGSDRSGSVFCHCLRAGECFFFADWFKCCPFECTNIWRHSG